jgi:hypothetical protein
MKYLLFLCLSCLVLDSSGQTTPATVPPGIDVVTVKLDQANFIQANFPFNIQFAIVGDAPADCSSIDLMYRIDPKDARAQRSWVTFPKINDGTFQPCDSWSNLSGTQFSLVCPGIHPNMSYDFQFVIKKKINLSDADKQTLKTSLSGAISVFYNKAILPAGYNQADRDALNTKLKTIVNDQLVKGNGVSLIDKTSGIVYTPDVTGNLKAPFDNVTGAIITYQNFYNAVYNSGGYKDEMIKEYKLIKPGICKAVDLTLTAQTKFLPQSKVYLGLTFNPSLSSFSNYTLMDGIKVLQNTCISSDLMDGIFSGKYKIVNKQIVATSPANTIDYESIYFIESLLNTLKDNILVIEGEKGKNVPQFSELNSATFQKAFKELMQHIRDVEKAGIAMQQTVKDFPDVSANLLISGTLNLKTVSIADVSTSKTPYISVDGGLGYSPTFQSAFSYYGANLYFAPVNKKAPLSNFKGWYYIRQILCVNVGVSNFFGARQDNSYSILGKTSNSDLIFGLGVRTGRIVKFNFDLMPYKTNNFDILTDNTKLKMAFVMSVGIDVNLLGALGNVAKTLNIAN